jgi:hypothetical protein
LKPGTADAILAAPDQVRVLAQVVVVARYLVLFSLTGETAKRFIAKPRIGPLPSARWRESAGGSLESYYWMFGPVRRRGGLRPA